MRQAECAYLVFAYAKLKSTRISNEISRDPNLLMLLGVVMFAVTGGSLVGPILPAMMELEGATSKNIGLALSSYTLAAMVATLALGPLADRFGRKTVIVPSVILFGIGGLLITVSQSFWQVLTWRALQGIGVGGMMNPVVAAIGDMFDEPERSQAMGLRVTVQGLTNATIPFVSGVVATILWFLPFYIHSLAIVLGIFIAIKCKDPSGAAKTERYLIKALGAIANIRATWLFFSNFIGFVLLYGIVVYMPILVVNHYGLTTMYSGLAISTAAGAAALVASQAGRLYQFLSEQNRVLAAFCCCGLSHFMVAMSGSYLMVLASLVVWGLGFGILCWQVVCSAQRHFDLAYKKSHLVF